MYLDEDAFTSGQVLSKLWLAETIEQVIIHNDFNKELNILNLGGWYGILHFIFKCRNKLKIKKYLNLDIDQEACDISEKINETWVWQNWKFKSISDDANIYKYTIDDFNVVINTSVEHMNSTQWFDNIPKDVLVILQSNDMPHEDHIQNHHSLEEFIKEFSLNEILYHGQKLFQYDDKSFKRFMLIGVK